MTLIERLKEECKLPESMGVRFIEYPNDTGVVTRAFIRRIEELNFDNDDCPGTALFIVRGLKALKEDRHSVSYFGPNEWEKRHIVLIIDEPALSPVKGHGNTMAQAVGEALIAAFPGEAQ